MRTQTPPASKVDKEINDIKALIEKIRAALALS
jgi:hypothetical protein